MKQQAKDHYRNPIWPHSFADPFMLKVRGRYFAYATEDVERPPMGAPVFPILTGDDLVDWRPVGSAMVALGEPYFRYWAPEVTEYSGRFFLYYAVHTEPFRAGIRVAVADRPEGPFLDSGHDLTSSDFSWAIDPHVFRDDDGEWYLFFTVEYSEAGEGLMGSGNAVDRLLDPFTTAGRPARVIQPTHAWQLFESRRHEKGGADWYCVEGPSVLRHRNRYYQMFSGGCYYRDNYAVSYATASRPMGERGMRDSIWQDQSQGGERLLMHGVPNAAISPGHNSVVLAPNNVDLYIAYHAWPQDLSARHACLDRLLWHGDELWTAAPTTTEQPAPSRPRFAARFYAPGTPEQSDWASLEGRWQVAEGAARQQDEQAHRALLRCAHPLDATWLLEINARAPGRAGRYGVQIGEGPGALLLLLEPERGSLLAAGGAPREPSLTHTALPAEFDPAAWHQFLIAGAGSTLHLRLDGRPMLKLDDAAPATSFALCTERCTAEFTAIALTDHFRDDFLDPNRSLPQLGWRAVDSMGHDLPQPIPSHWQLEYGVLRQRNPGGRWVLLKGTRSSAMEYGATMALAQVAPSGQPAFGITVLSDGENGVEFGITQADDTWQLITRDAGVPDPVVTQHPLGPAFDPHAWHTLRVTCRATTCSVTLDGSELFAVGLPPGARSAGIYTDGASVAFSSIWQTGL